MNKIFKPSSTFTHSLQGLDSFTSPPFIIYPSLMKSIDHDHAQRLANGTGALVVLSDYTQSLSFFIACINALKEDPKTTSLSKVKVGAFGFDSTASLFQELTRLNLFNAVSMISPNLQLQELKGFKDFPIASPCQAHFAIKSLDEMQIANALHDLWEKAIMESGGTHAHGLHSDEENVYYYNVNHGFMDFHSKESDLAWNRIFKFFKSHLKEL